jgi:hypothetical protein
MNARGTWSLKGRLGGSHAFPVEVSQTEGQEVAHDMKPLRQVYSSPLPRGVAAFAAAVFLWIEPVSAQPGFGFGGFGFNQQELKIVKMFDKDGNGRLNREERQAARDYLTKVPRRRRGWGGSGATRPGPKLTPGDVKVYGEEPLYDMKVLRTLFLEFEGPDWENELADFYGTDVDVPATIVVDGKQYRDVGVHFRGNSSYFTVPAGLKRSLHLSLDFAHDKQRLGGYRTLVLLNSHTDPTYLRTVLYNEIARQYIPAPKANFMRVVINGESWGIYVNAQQFNSDFTQENYGSRKGARWHVPGSPRARGGLAYLGEDATQYKYSYEIKTKDDPASWADFIRLCKVLNTTPPDKLEEALAPILDIDGVLRFLALDIALLNSDGYWIRQSDYNIYEDEKGKFHVIPHDANETLREPEMGWGGGSLGGIRVDPLYSAADANKPLYRLLLVPSLRAKYLGYIKDIAENWMDWRKMGPKAREYQMLIVDDVKADTHKLDSFSEFGEGVTGVLEGTGGGFNSSPGTSLRTFFEQRRAYLLNYPGNRNGPEKSQ